MPREADHYLTEEEARQFYTSGDSAHDFDHVLRVTHMGERLAQAEGADVTVVRLAALLHDIAITDDQTTRRAHHAAAAEFARRLLTERGLGTERVASVVHCIEAHRFRDQSIQPQTLEAQCLYDADKLDSIGAIGVARAFAFAGRYDERLWTMPWRAAPLFEARPIGADYTPVHEFVYKLQRLLDTLHTATARKLGANRHAFMVTYFNQLDEEMQGQG
jgi:uncharacterized protein